MGAVGELLISKDFRGGTVQFSVETVQKTRGAKKLPDR